MLSEQSKAIVAATLPAVSEHANAITGVFYPLMFERYPSVKAYFNQAHQAQGTQPQALANAVVAYAANLDRLEALGDAVSLIVNKHVSLNILPEHYPIVGECLLAAIKEVLGEAATDEVLAAWGEAYAQLADLLIAAEEQRYRDNESRPGGWRGERRFRLSRKEAEGDVITSFYFVPADGGLLADYQPGQYLCVILEVEGQTVRRNYSLSDSPGRGYYRISVKREAGGTVSNHLHDHLEIGDEVRLTVPSGDFVLNNHTRPLVLLSGGVGITPTLSMLASALATGREVYCLHGSVNSRHHAFREHVEALDKAHANLHVHFIYSQPLEDDVAHGQGYFDQHALDALLPVERDLDVYFLGPKPFMQGALKALSALGVPRENVHYEFFGPLEPLAD